MAYVGGSRISRGVVDSQAAPILLICLNSMHRSSQCVLHIIVNVEFIVVAADVFKGTVGTRPLWERTPCMELMMSCTLAVNII